MGVRRVGLALVAPVLTTAALAGAHGTAVPVVLDNVTPSLPLGLYRHVAGGPKLGAVVAVRQPEGARPYLRGLGFPPEASLLKRVSALQGERVCAQGERVIVGERVLVRSARDRRDFLLPQWQGCRSLGPSEVFLIGDDARSFDSRYFGPVSTSSVVGVYKRLR